MEGIYTVLELPKSVLPFGLLNFRNILVDPFTYTLIPGPATKTRFSLQIELLPLGMI